MEKSSKSNSFIEIAHACHAKFPSECWKILKQFLSDYEKILEKKGLNPDNYRKNITTYCDLVLKQLISPQKFASFHKSIRSPTDYYKLGLEIFRPLIDFEHSTLGKISNIDKIDSYIKNGENVILFANHQIEADPSAICLLLEKNYDELAEKMIFVAGERVITDPLAVPFSSGVNLFCIYSKKYFDAHPDRKTAMLEHNKVTMLVMSQHLSQGGKCIYIAPSGGRDRRNKEGVLEVAKFDPQSVELLYLLGRKANKPTHFFPLSLSTHDILPPPEDLQVALGEKRPTNTAPIHIYFGDEIDMENFPHDQIALHDKQKKKDARASYIWKLVSDQYHKLPN